MSVNTLSNIFITNNATVANALSSANLTSNNATLSSASIGDLTINNSLNLANNINLTCQTISASGNISCNSLSSPTISCTNLNLNSVDLNTRITAIETKNTNQDNSISSIINRDNIQDASINTINNTSIPNLQSQITTSANNINTINNTSIPNLQNQITTSANNINTINNTSIPNLQSQITTSANEVNSLNTKTTNISYANNLTTIAGSIVSNDIVAPSNSDLNIGVGSKNQIKLDRMAITNALYHNISIINSSSFNIQKNSNGTYPSGCVYLIYNSNCTINLYGLDGNSHGQIFHFRMCVSGTFYLNCIGNSTLQKLDNSFTTNASFANYNQIALIYLDQTIIQTGQNTYLYWIKSTNG